MKFYYFGSPGKCFLLPLENSTFSPHPRKKSFRFPCLHKWGMATSATCESGAENQNIDHVVFQCPIHRHSYGLHGLTVLGDETVEWLLNTCPEICAVKQWTGRTGSNDDDEPSCAYVAYCRYSHLNQHCRAGIYMLNKLIIKTLGFFIHSFSSPIPPWKNFPPRD